MIKKTIELMNMSESELNEIFKDHSAMQLKEFLTFNDIPFRPSFSRKKLFELTVSEIIMFGIYYRIGHQ